MREKQINKNSQMFVCGRNTQEISVLCTVNNTTSLRFLFTENYINDVISFSVKYRWQKVVVHRAKYKEGG